MYIISSIKCIFFCRFPISIATPVNWRLQFSRFLKILFSLYFFFFIYLFVILRGCYKSRMKTLESKSERKKDWNSLNNNLYCWFLVWKNWVFFLFKIKNSVFPIRSTFYFTVILIRNHLFIQLFNSYLMHSFIFHHFRFFHFIFSNSYSCISIRSFTLISSIHLRLFIRK